jgi:hypothetical protein
MGAYRDLSGVSYRSASGVHRGRIGKVSSSVEDYGELAGNPSGC